MCVFNKEDDIMKKTKAVLAIMMASAMVAGLAGCGSTDTTTTPSSTTGAVEAGSGDAAGDATPVAGGDRKSTRLNSSHRL